MFSGLASRNIKKAGNRTLGNKVGTDLSIVVICIHISSQTGSQGLLFFLPIDDIIRHLTMILN